MSVVDGVLAQLLTPNLIIHVHPKDRILYNIIIITMKVLFAFLAILAVAAAFAPMNSVQQKQSAVSLNAESVDRKAFLVGAVSFFGAAAAANAMDQVNESTPTEVWETGKATVAVKKSRQDKFKNARTQLNSNFAPVKRLTLERKSPVTRLDLNAPYFEGYKQSFPGLYKSAPTK